MFREFVSMGLLPVCAATSSAPVAAAAEAPSGQVLAAFALYTQNQDSGATLNLARVILNGVGQTCPAVPAVTGMQARVNPDPRNFPITVCEGIYSSGTPVTVPGSSLALPAIPASPKNVVVFGDTGYESSQVRDHDWVFPDLAAQAVGQAPDVVLHMGDYNYSGTPGEIEVDGQSVQVYDAGDNTTEGVCRISGGYYGQNSVGSDHPDTWATWKSNFFDAAQGLLSAAPFVFLRGNHELCSRAGTGWFYLLDANNPQLGRYARQLGCPSATNPTPTVSTPPYLVALGGLNVAVLDSTNACDSGLLNVDDYVNQFALLKRLARDAPEAAQTWLLSHRPIWGVNGVAAVGTCGGDTGAYCYISQTLQAADAETQLSHTVNLVVSGHMHRFQVVDFGDGDHPQQFILGNGGVKLDALQPTQMTTLEIDGRKATVMGLREHGYMRFVISGAGWNGTLLGVGGKTLAVCQSDRNPMCSE